MRQKRNDANRGVPSQHRGVAVGVAVAVLAILLTIFVIPVVRRTDHKPIPPSPGPPSPLTDGTEAIRDLVVSASREFVYFSKKVKVGNAFYSHIFRQHIVSRAERDLTPDATWDITQVAVSRELLVFRSERVHGLVAVNLEGQNERLLTSFGHGPNISPDGQFVVFADEQMIDPRHRQQPVSRLYLLSLASGNYRSLTPDDAVQPRFTPDGKRIVFGAIDQGKRVIGSVDINGGSPMVLVKNHGCVWAPLVTPDGRQLLYVGDFSGVPNIWSLPLAEATGAPVGAPQVFSGLAGVIDISVAPDYLGTVIRTGPGQSMQRLAIDEPGAGQSSVEIWTQLRSPDIARGSEYVVAYTDADNHEDIVITDREGRFLIRLTNNGHFNRGPRFSHDGERVVYYSNQAGGKYQVFRINADGTGNQQLTFLDSHVAYPAFSPDDRHLVIFIVGKGSAILDLETLQIHMLPSLPDESSLFVGWQYSPDGKKIVGYGSNKKDGSDTGVWVFHLDTYKYRRITKAGKEPVWNSDGIQVAYQNGNSLLFVNTSTLNTKAIYRLEGPHKLSGGFALSPDDRYLWFGVQPETTQIILLPLVVDLRPLALLPANQLNQAGLEVRLVVDGLARTDPLR